MSVKQISVFLENRPGTLHDLTRTLADGGIDLRAMSVAETKDFGIARMIVDDLDRAHTVLKEAQFVNSMTPVIAVAVDDVKGGLARVLDEFAKANVNVEYMYSALASKATGQAYMIMRVTDTQAAEKTLSAMNVKLVSQEELAAM
ncbi:MAG: ACT domain-containing protein [Lachnospiraceae bacterium]|nr:ACT domain-containing protein [Lachnospiraceae bacterium]